MDRNILSEKIKNLICLEIGALVSPIVKNGYYLDHLNKNDLVEKYKNDPNVDVSKIVNVDFIYNPNLRYDEYISSKFDVVVSSHNIEHQPNLVKHLNDLESILVNNGEAHLWIPDYRYEFDHYKSESNIIDVLDNYFKDSKRTSFIKQMEMHLLQTENDSGIQYSRYKKETRDDYLNIKRNLLNKITNFSLEYLKSIHDSTEYVDTHVWNFTPSGFESIINILYLYKLTKFKIKYINQFSRSHEFFVTLIKEN